MKRLFLLFAGLFAITLLTAQTSQLVVTSVNAPFVFSINGIAYSQTPTNSIEVNQMQPGCYDVAFTFTDGGVYQTCVYVPENSKIVYLLKFVNNMPKLLPINVVDFDEPTFNPGASLNQVQGYLTNPMVININVQNQNQNTNTNINTGQGRPGVPQPPMPPVRTGVSETEFQGILSTIEDQTFESDMLAMAKQIISTRPLTSYQIKRILDLFSFEDTKLKLAKFAYNYVIDPENYFIVADAFTFSSSKQKLLKYIEQMQMQGY